MDRNVVTATILIVLILFVWMYFLAPPPPPPPTAEEAPTVDTIPAPDASAEPDVQALTAPPQTVSTAVIDSTIAGAQEGQERFVTVETDLYQARFSTKGATLVSFLLKDYKQFDQQTPVQLVDSTAGGALGLVFTTPASHVVDTRTFFFEPSFTGERLQVTSEGTTLSFEKQLGQGGIRMTYTFTPGTYEVGLSVLQQQATTFQTAEGYEMVWNGAVPFSEDPQNRKEEGSKIGAYGRSGGEVEGVTLLSETEEDQSLRGDITWVAVKNKYFAAVVLPDEPAREAELLGERTEDLGDPDLKAAFRASLFMGSPTAEPDNFRLYLGPLEYYQLSEYDGLYDMVDYGWDAFEWMTRPLATFIFIPAFTFLSSFIPNYGLVIIIFALVIKVALFPLTKSSYKSMAQMRELQPKMQEIKEKHADNPQKQQEATMKLYRESGTNPLGSCLPMLLQYPIIIALWQFLQQSLEIRQQGFLWATDLSAPDAILHLPFTIPLYGNFVAGFTILMGLSMIIQMRIQATPASGAQAKVFMYVMPGVIFVIFNSLPSGLSLYYLCYNVITALQQKWINKSIEDEKALAEASGGKKPATKAARAAGVSKNGRHKKGGTKKGGKSKKGGRSSALRNR